MEPDSTQSSGYIKFLAWLELNKKRLLIWGGASVGVILAVVVMLLLQKERETRASGALSEVETRSNSGAAPPASLADQYLKVARDFAGTRAAGRALLLHAEALYVDREYSQAQARFEEFLRLYPDSPWVAQGLFGIAASLDAQNNNEAAMAKYEELRRRFGANPIVDQARLSLARLYESANRLEEAKQIYEELKQTHAGGGMGAEAGMRLEDLLKKHPELAQTNAPSALTAVPPTAGAVLTSAVPVVVTNTPASPANPGLAVTQAPVQIKLSTPATNPAPTPDSNP